MPKPENPGQQGRDNAAEKQARNAERQANRPAENDEDTGGSPEVPVDTGDTTSNDV